MNIIQSSACVKQFSLAHIHKTIQMLTEINRMVVVLLMSITSLLIVWKLYAIYKLHFIAEDWLAVSISAEMINGNISCMSQFSNFKSQI